MNNGLSVFDNSTAAPQPETPDPDGHLQNATAGSLILVISAIGVIVNVLATMFVFRLRTFRNAFGYICVSHCVGDLGVLVVFMVWCAPRTIFQATDEYSLLSRKLGQLSLVFWFGSLYSQLLLAFNRFVAITTPSIYRWLFNNRNSVRLIIFIWFLACCHGCVYFFQGCDFVYNTREWYWEFAQTECGNFISYYLDFLFGVVVCGVVLVVDVLTIIQLNMMSSAVLGHHRESNIERRRRLRRDLRFFAQACITAGIFSAMLCSFHIIYSYATTKWTVFITTTFAWCLSHTCDGLVIILFNSEFRRILCRPSEWFHSIQASAGITVTVAATNTATTNVSMRGRERK